jgi:hypothetical protein
MKEYYKKESPIISYAGYGGGATFFKGAAGAKTYVDDVFASYAYTGDNSGSTQTFNTGLDMSGEGGMIWFKSRSNSQAGRILDTVRGTNESLIPTSTNGSGGLGSNGLTFLSNGFSLGWTGGDLDAANDYISWSFRKAPGFFDIVTWSGNSGSKVISHNLESVPGMVIIKQTSPNGNNWYVYHRSTGVGKALSLNTTDKAENRDDRITAISSTTFTLGNSSEVNMSGRTYVAYIFAHDDQQFGTGGAESIIKCGSYTGNGTSGSSVNTINLGFEPQWVMIKKSSATGGNWLMLDTIRGFTSLGSVDEYMYANSSSGENPHQYGAPTATGFQLEGTDGSANTNGATYVYMAIRRPNKPPEAATDVFEIDPYSGSSTLPFVAPFAPDLAFIKNTSSSSDWFWADRQRLDRSIRSNSSNSEQSGTAYNVQFRGAFSSSWTNYIGYLLKRAPGFFDLVSFKGNSSSTQNVSHNLKTVPEMMILKSRSGGFDWNVYHASLGNNKALVLNDTSVPGSSTTNAWNNTTPTASVFSVGDNAYTNQGNQDVVAFLFASLNGISKVGSYNGSSSSVNVDCGFTNGARFVMIKRTDSTGNWVVFDTVRGINSGNDPYLQFNTNDQQNNSYDAIDTLASGFTVNSGNGNYNTHGGTYIFLAIA